MVRVRGIPIAGEHRPAPDAQPGDLLQRSRNRRPGFLALAEPDQDRGKPDVTKYDLWRASPRFARGRERLGVSPEHIERVALDRVQLLGMERIEADMRLLDLDGPGGLTGIHENGR